MLVTIPHNMLPLILQYSFNAQLQYATLQTSMHNGHQEHSVPMGAGSVWPLNRRVGYYVPFRNNKGLKERAI